MKTRNLILGAGAVAVALIVLTIWRSTPVPEPSLSDCLGGMSFEVAPEVESDTHGQGELLGVGFHVKAFPELVRIDQIDLASARTKAGEPITDVVVEAHGLRGKAVIGGQSTEIVGAGWADATLVGTLHCVAPKEAGHTRPVTLRIADVTQRAGAVVDGSPGQIWVHKLEIALDATHDHLPGCSARPDVAFPIAGHWSATGAYVADSKTFSFACTERGAAVCMQWGESYQPGSFGEATVPFQGCARMMRADYCGDGRSYTLEGTLVSWLQKGNDGVTASDDSHHFEAAWDANGAVCIDHPRWKGPLGCSPKECHSWKDIYDLGGAGWVGFVNGSCLNPVTPPGVCSDGSSRADPGPKTGPI